MNSFIKNLFRFSASSTDNEDEAADLAWLKSLDAVDDVAALNLATKHLSSLIADETRPIKQRIDFLFAVDHKALPRATKLSAQYAKVDSLRPELATTISNAAYNYYRQSYLNYLRLVELIIASPKDPSLENNTLLIVIARALDLAMTMIKWRYFDHSSTPAKVWQQTHMLYEIATKTNLLEIPIKAFEYSAPTTIAAYIAQVSLFGSLENANMQKQHYQIAAYLLKCWLTEVSFSNQINQGTHLFVIDLKKDACAKRTRHFEQTDSCRFWQIDAFEEKIISTLQLTEQGKLPPDIPLAEIGDVRSLHETLQVLRSEWSKNEYIRQRRKETRQETNHTASIAYGILDICNLVDYNARKQLTNKLSMPTSTNKSLDDRLFSHASIRREGPTNVLYVEPKQDIWAITDESTKGLGARAPKEAKSWVKSGKLVAVAMDERPPRVLIAIIRGVMPSRHLNQVHVGLEVIARFANWAQMRPIEPPPSLEPIDKFSPLASNNAITMGFSVLYLPIEAGLSEESTLILPKIEYRANEVYEITLNGTTKLIRLGNPIDAKDDWVRVIFPHINT